MSLFERSIFLIVFLIPTLLLLFRRLRKRQNLKQMNFNGKIIWITGASSGIGEALCYKFSELGAKLIITSRRSNELERVRKNCKTPEDVEIFAMDMANIEQLENSVNEYFSNNPEKKVDILINNAGLSMRASCLEHTFEKDKYMMTVNFLSVVALTKIVLRQMMKFKSGHLVVVSSIQGKIGIASRTTYAASKHALIGYYDSLRAEISNDISVSVICPGYVRTNLDENASYVDEKSKELKAEHQRGMSAESFAQRFAEAVFNKENETIIDEGILSRMAVMFRNLCPDLVFKMIARKTRTKKT